MRSFLLVRRRFCLALDDDTLAEAAAEDRVVEGLVRFEAVRLEEMAVEERREVGLLGLWLLGRGLFLLAFHRR